MERRTIPHRNGLVLDGPVAPTTTPPAGAAADTASLIIANVAGMNPTERDVELLKFVAEHYTVIIRQVWERIFPHDKDGSIVRKRVGRLHAAGLLNKTRPELVIPGNGSSAAIFYPSRKGCEFLALRTGDMRYLLVPTQTPQTQHLAHFVALTDLRLLVHDAVAAQDFVRMPLYFNEFDVVNREAESPAEHFRLYTLIREKPRLVCVPDGAFLLQAGDAARAYYIELERGTSAPKKAAAEKSPGYAALAKGKLHRRHFPEATEDFGVLVFAPHANWRRDLQRAFAKKDAPELYSFCSMTDVTPQTFLYGPIWHSCDESKPPVALIDRGE